MSLSNIVIILFRDINKELETMRQLLKEIVKRITDNLLGKSSNGSDHGGFTREENQSVKHWYNLFYLLFISIIESIVGSIFFMQSYRSNGSI